MIIARKKKAKASCAESLLPCDDSMLNRWSTVDAVFLSDKKVESGGDHQSVKKLESNLWLFAANVNTIKIYYCVLPRGDKKIGL